MRRTYTPNLTLEHERCCSRAIPRACTLAARLVVAPASAPLPRAGRREGADRVTLYPQESQLAKRLGVPLSRSLRPHGLWKNSLVSDALCSLCASCQRSN